jgi:subtilisin family serine protease
MKRVLFVLLSVIAAAAMTFSVAGAGNPFAGLTTTAQGYSTWDADMINAEGLSVTGNGVYVAVLDTGLVPNWQDYFPKERVNTKLGIGFDQPVSFSPGKDPCELDVNVGQLHQTTWVGSTGSTHATHVASTIIGFFYRSNSDAAGGYPLPPMVVRGIAPNVTIIPVKVLADYQVPAMPKCEAGYAAESVVFGTDEMVAAGINYVTDLKLGPLAGSPVVINMSLGGPELAEVEQQAIDRAVANGVIIVASAGNEGEAGMGYPGAYAPVISAGSVGWTREWMKPTDTIDTFAGRYRMFWLKNDVAPMLAGSGNVADPTNPDDVYLSDFSSRALAGQELDVLAPGSWVRGPYPGDPGFSHLPWWSKGIADLVGGNPGNFYYLGGTSMAAPHVTAAAALLLEKSPALTQAQIEAALKSATLPLPQIGDRTVYDISPVAGWTYPAWDTDCNGAPCDPVGAGLIQLDMLLH